jgi:hypothetical protein
LKFQVKKEFRKITIRVPDGMTNPEFWVGINPYTYTLVLRLKSHFNIIREEKVRYLDYLFNYQYLLANDRPRRVLAIKILRRHTLTNLNSRYNPRLSTIRSRDFICAGHHMIRRIGAPRWIGLREYDLCIVIFMGTDDAAVSTLAFGVRVEALGLSSP